MTNNKAQCAREPQETIEEFRKELLRIYYDTGFWEMVGSADEMQEMASGLIEGLDVATQLFNTHPNKPKALANIWSFLVSGYQWLATVQAGKIEAMEDIIGLMLEKHRHMEGVQRIKDSFSD
jgi:hypothetical protein